MAARSGAPFASGQSVKLFRGSSAAERLAVNEMVVGSIPTPGVERPSHADGFSVVVGVIGGILASLC